MTKHLAYLVLLLISYGLQAQDWSVDYKTALTTARDAQKPIVLVFAGSDWCAPCIKLDRQIWQSSEFIAYSKEHWVLYKADFPRKKTNKLSAEMTAKNGRLAEMFNPKGHFPLVVIINSDQQVLGTMGYEKISPKEYISRINSYIK